MRILITNDDGIHAPGLGVLENIAKALTDDVYVVAPETDQSGVAHSLSLSDPLRLRKISERHYAVKGTPTDCIIMGVRNILIDKKPDLVLSGVNRGQNVAEDVTYSGTIAGAIEGTILGIPSVALSQQFGPESAANPHWKTAETHAPAVLRKLMETGFAAGAFVNINFPDCPPEEVKGVAATAQGVRSAELLRIDARHDGRGMPYYWIAFHRGPYTPGPGTDLEALAAKKVSVTPLRLDLTDHDALAALAKTLPMIAPAHETRGALVLALRSAGIGDLDVLRAIETVPREDFLPHALRDLGPRNVAVPIACGQTMLPPLSLALMLVAAEIEPTHRVLEIGTGTGYATAVLARLAREVVSFERYRTLAIEAEGRLRSLEIEAKIVVGDGLAFPAEFGRFDRIIVHLALTTIPPPLDAALADGGRIVAGIPAGVDGPASLAVFTRDAEAFVERRVARLSLALPETGVAHVL